MRTLHQTQMRPKVNTSASAELAVYDFFLGNQPILQSSTYTYQWRVNALSRKSDITVLNVDRAAEHVSDGPQKIPSGPGFRNEVPDPAALSPR